MNIFLKKSLHSLFKDSLFFFFLSLVVLTPLSILNEKYTQEIKTIIEEHMAPHSLAAILVIATSIASLTLRFIGRKDNSKKYNEHIYTFIIFPVVKAGKSYASTMVGMMSGLALISLLSEGASKILVPLLLISCIIMYWFLFEAIMYFSINGVPSNISKKMTNIFLLMIVFIIPIWYLYGIYSS